MIFRHGFQGIHSLTAQPAKISGAWLHAKLALVAALVAYHFWMGHYVRAFARDVNTHTHVFYRWINELPLVLLVAIVILVVVKPF